MDETSKLDSRQTALCSFDVLGAPPSGDRPMRERFAQLIALDVQFSVLAIGIDNFTRINNLFSYSFGDKVLGSLSLIVTELLPPDASLYRFDGDCFGIILPDITDSTLLDGYFERILLLTNNGISIRGTNISFSVSGGVCGYPRNGGSADELYRNLHIALFYAKSQGKGQCTHCTCALCNSSQRTLLLMETLQQCVAHNYDGFSVHYQPMVNAHNERIHGCEALIRWNNHQFPEGVRPFEFIPCLEESGLICSVTSWLIDVAFAQAASWTTLNPSFIMSVNLSRRVLEQPGLARILTQAAKAHHLSPHNVMLELTESSKVEEILQLNKTLNLLRSQGFIIAIDDFGTGYSSLSMFRTITIDELKIDRSFLEHIANNTKDQLIVAQVIELCHHMNIAVCVEGVETYETLQIIRELGADIVQGFYYGQPVDANTFEHRHLAHSINNN